MDSKNGSSALMCGSGSHNSGRLSIFYPKGLTGDLIVFDDAGKVAVTFQADGSGWQDFAHQLDPGEYHFIMLSEDGCEKSLLAVSGLAVI